MSGVVVTSVDQAGAAYREGLREGDLILSVNRQPIKNAVQFYADLAGRSKGDTVLLRVMRQGNSFFIAFTL